MNKTKRVHRSGKSLIRQMDKTCVPQDGIVIWHLGQAGVAVKTDEVICYFDPYLSDYVNTSGLAGLPGSWPRQFEPPLEPVQVANAGYVFITHDHLDHLDPVSVKGIDSASPDVRFICPAPAVSILRELGIAEKRIIPARAGVPLNEAGMDIMPIACKHEEYLVDENGDHAYLGYVVQSNGVTFYHAGDTILHRELIETLRAFSIDAAFLPINGGDFMRLDKGIVGNMGFREAADLAHLLQVDLVIPIHYDLFHFNADNPAYFVDYVYRNYPGQCFKMMVPGERMVYLAENDEE
ncbi:MBL fold metallo-hydrolase [Domibacillus tundrae]|uniref:MBL fold metallo-hydrolase n=1 Tax=Domibacillus tundrae TaxID=1587527 RepID=UPI000617BA7E|nr:MBL fold metallo-hydrolase [Domibacillus tundrae]